MKYKKCFECEKELISYTEIDSEFCDSCNEKIQEL